MRNPTLWSRCTPSMFSYHPGTARCESRTCERQSSKKIQTRIITSRWKHPGELMSVECGCKSVCGSSYSNSAFALVQRSRHELCDVKKIVPFRQSCFRFLLFTGTFTTRSTSVIQVCRSACGHWKMRNRWRDKCGFVCVLRNSHEVTFLWMYSNTVNCRSCGKSVLRARIWLVV